MEPERVKISVAAKILNVTPLTLRRGIYADRVPFIKTNTNRLFIPMAWIRQQTNTLDSIEWSTKEIYAIITSFCIKTYGKEKGQKKVEGIIKLLEAK